MKDLTSAQKKFLKGLAHSLDPIVLIGKKGLTTELSDAVAHALDDHELIKVKFNEFKEDKKQLSKQLEQETESTLVGLVGNTVILYKEQKNKKKRKIEI